MAKRAGRVGFKSGQSGRESKRVTGQNGSFLNGSIGLRVADQTGLTRFAMSTHRWDEIGKDNANSFLYLVKGSVKEMELIMRQSFLVSISLRA